MSQGCRQRSDFRWSFVCTALFFLVVGFGASVCGQDKGLPIATQDQIDQSIEKGVRWLVATQEVDGGWRGPHPEGFQTGMTGLAVYALLKTGMPADHRVIRKGLAFMNSKKCALTYEVGTNLLAYSAVPASFRPKRRVKQLTQLLITTLDDKGWRYNRPTNNVIDLSNGQYAILGLRAAVAMGEKVPAAVWEQAAQIFMDLQGYYGGWGYKENCGWVDAGMTVAGIFCLAACHEQLKDRRKSRQVVRKLKSKIDLGLTWFEKNWSVNRNVILPTKKDTRVRYLYHYLYGLERVGALTGLDLIGGHDWYSEGASFIVKKQTKKGSWSTAYGEHDVNCSLALLFLSRGTNTTFGGKRKKSPVLGDSAKTLTIRANGENPMVAWIMKFDELVKARLDKGERISSLVWTINGETVHRVTTDGDLAIRDESTFLRHKFTSNGKFEVVAQVEFVNADGDSAGAEKSAPAIMWVDDVEGPADREAIADTGKNRLARVEVSTTASSQWNDKNRAKNAVDGLFSTSWVCADDDHAPNIVIRLGKRVKAKTLKIVGAQDYGNPTNNWARPRDLVIVINGRKKISHTLTDDVGRKHAIPIGQLNVRKLKITIKSVYPGKTNPRRVGFKEIELFKN